MERIIIVGIVAAFAAFSLFLLGAAATAALGLAVAGTALRWSLRDAAARRAQVEALIDEIANRDLVRSTRWIGR